VLAFTMTVGTSAGILFGLVPAVQASKPDVVDALKDSDRTGGSARRRFGIRDVLVVGQVALSLVALVGAGLFLRSLEATRKTDPGFEAKNLLSVAFDLGLQGYNQTMAKKFWPKGDALGKRFHFFGASEPWAEIVGVARNAKYNFLGEDPQSYIYEAHTQRYSGAQTLIVRTTGNPASLLVPVERELKALDPDVPLTALATVSKTIDDGRWAPRAGASLLGLFGLLALVLAAVGIYSVMSYSVSQRRREIGIRMALGARRQDVLRMMLGRGMRVVAVGLAVGLVISFSLARLAASLLVGVSPGDATSFAGAAAVLAVVAVAANFFATRRAAGIDPTVALRA
jgi:hypothetical protein